MSSSRSRNHYKDSERGQNRPKAKSSKDKKLSKLIESASDTDEGSEHELSYYLDDRVKLMKEVLKIIKNPRKIKSMAPDCMKDMDLQEVNSMLLEELLGISNKRLRYIFEGKVLDEESSTDEDQPSVDVISLDDISEDDFVVISDDETDKGKGKHRRRKIKQEAKDKSKKIKKEQPNKEKTKDIEKIKEKLSRKENLTSKEKETIGEENLMSVLELLELQARARAIKSQLELENKRKQEEMAAQKEIGNQNDDDDDEEIIMEVPKEVEIVITSSESENEDEKAGSSKDQQILVAESISTVDESSQESHNRDQNHVTVTERENNHGQSDIEDGEICDTEAAKSVEKIKEKTIIEDISIINKEPNLSNKSDSNSDSDDTLQVVKEREQRKKQTKSKIVESQGNDKDNDNGEEENLKETNKNDESAEEESNKTSQVSKIDEAVEEFVKTLPPPPDNTLELKKIEEEQKKKEVQEKMHKNKRLKLFKNKLQSYKEDVAVDMDTSSSPSTSAIKVLENIIIKPRKARSESRSHKSLDESDDLVINVDQDDIDCIICD